MALQSKKGGTQTCAYWPMETSTSTISRGSTLFYSNNRWFFIILNHCFSYIKISQNDLKNFQGLP